MANNKAAQGTQTTTEKQDQNSEVKSSNISKIRRAKRNRRLRNFFVILLFACGLAAFLGGMFDVPVSFLQNTALNIEIALNPGDGFPVNKDLTNFLHAQQMSGGLYVLDDSNVYIYSDSAKELRSAPHSFVNPIVTSNDNRLAVYSPGSNYLTVEGKGETLYNYTSDQPITFAQLGPGGSIAIFTPGRLEIKDPWFDFKWQWDPMDETPLAFTFGSSDTNFALACLDMTGGMIGTKIHIGKTSKIEIDTTIYAHGAVPVYMDYSGNTLTVIYDTFAAVYNASSGEMLYSYTYSSTELIGVSKSKNGNYSLLFNPVSYPGLACFTVLDEDMNLIFSTDVDSSAHAITATAGHVYVLCANTVERYNYTAEHTGTLQTNEKPLSVIDAKDELLITSKGVFPLVFE